MLRGRGLVIGEGAKIIGKEFSVPKNPARRINAPTELETERLRFRLFRFDDFPTYEQWCARMDIMRYLGGKTFDRLYAFRHMAYLIGH